MAREYPLGRVVQRPLTEGFPLPPSFVEKSASRSLKRQTILNPEDLRAGTGSRIDIALAGLLVLLGCALFLYNAHRSMTVTRTKFVKCGFESVNHAH
jgi:hypothetical protein